MVIRIAVICGAVWWLAPATDAVGQPVKQTLFLANSSANPVGGGTIGNIGVFTVCPSGTLTPVAGTPFAGGHGVRSLKLNAAGEVLVAAYAASGAVAADGSVRCFSVGQDGTLSELARSPIPFPGDPADLTVAKKSGREFVYVAAIFNPVETIHAYEIIAGPAGPTLATVPGSPFSTNGFLLFGLSGITATPDGAYLYVGHYSGGLDGFAIADDGSLSPLPATPLANGNRLISPVISPDGQHLYVGNDSQTSKIYGLTLHPDGTLTLLPGSPYVASFATPDTPGSPAISPDGEWMFVAHVSSDTVTVLSRAADGTLSLVPGSSVPIGPHTRTVRADNFLSFVTDQGNGPVFPGSTGVRSFTIPSNGLLQNVPGSPFAVGNEPLDLALWTPPIGPGDADGDQDVDLNDYSALADCLLGPGVDPPATTCLDPLDLDCDADIDLVDVGRFSVRFSAGE